MSVWVKIYIGFLGLGVGACFFMIGWVIVYGVPTYRCVVFDDPGAPDIGHAYTCTIIHHKGGVSVSATGEGK